MTLTLELVIFFIFAVVAIFSAAFMLISRNAVHSALFLVTNFLCVALFYLMLNAPFLAMIQVTVYAGAIMVLFMFVIMLLGSEKLATAQGPFRWLAPAAVGLTTLFLVVAFFVVVQSNVGLLKPVAPQPQVRVAHAIPGAPAVDIYLNDVKALGSVAYKEVTSFGKVLPGDYVMKLYPACEEADTSKCADPVATNAKPLVEDRITLASNTATTYVVAGTAAAPKVITVPTDLSTMADDRGARVIAVNTLPSQTVSLVKVNPANTTDTQVVVPDLAPNTASQAVQLDKGVYNLTWTSGTDNQRIMSLTDVKLASKTADVMVLTQEPVAGSDAGRLATVRLTAAPTNEEYGSPQQIGMSLLSSFLLPFELVSLLLLAAMVGAIILTREEFTKRVRSRVSMTAAASRINRAAAAAQSQQSESSAD